MANPDSPSPATCAPEPESRIRRQDYRPPDYQVQSVDLELNIGEITRVESRLVVCRSQGVPADRPWVLDGKGFQLESVYLDQQPVSLATLQRSESTLTLSGLPERFVLHIVTWVDHEANRSLEGLYRSGEMLCTQCEAEGFSRLTYFPDRPDVLALYRVRIEADRARYPVLLSNGEPVGSGELPGGRHFALWSDPFPKPCYLFAVVAGRLACIEDRHLTGSGRVVNIRFYVDPGDEGRVRHAIDSLKRAMAWDERVFGLECDLDTYMVVAARDFNMGAMENKGLNLFNSRYVLASPESATDADFHAVESVIAHEYFHNWTGNRVTCQSWFELSLKEGLTVYRDQCFSADHSSAPVQRIGEVRQLRTYQFAEDAGPMAHPVRPDEYLEVSNLYTTTVYEKGAELIRMLCTLLGEESFITGVRQYLARHDGRAATIEDFLAAQEAVSGQNLQSFRHWYAQAGTPVVSVSDDYQAQEQRYSLNFRQHTPSTPGQAAKQPLPIPIRFALHQVPDLRMEHACMPRPDLIVFDTEQLRLDFQPLPNRPLPSFLHGFSAPVRLQYAYTGEQLVQLLRLEGDGFARWEAAQRLMLNAFFELLGSAPGPETAALTGALQHLAGSPPEDRALLAELLRLPSETYLAAQLTPLDAAKLCMARDRLRLEIARSLTGPLSVWAQGAPEESGAAAAGRRALSNLALWYLAATGSNRVLNLCLERSANANMTLSHGALLALNDSESDQREQAMTAFRERWQHDPLVMDKWFALQAGSASPGGIERVGRLLRDEAFSLNPNRVRAVLVTFWRENLRAFHRPDGSGYVLLGSEVERIDRHNPQLAARLVDGLLGWRDSSLEQGKLQRGELLRLEGLDLSPDVREKVGKALEG